MGNHPSSTYHYGSSNSALSTASYSNMLAWLKIMADTISQFFTIMTADRFEGPYETVHKIYHPLGMDSGDFCLHVDEQTDKAYIWFERPHFQLICGTLTDDYTQVSNEYSVHFDGLHPPRTREAPTFFQHQGRKYLITSGTSGYSPNPSRVCVFDDYHGHYRDLGKICLGDMTGTTFNAQITCVIRIPGTNRLIACADRWIPQWWSPIAAKFVAASLFFQFLFYKPDLSVRNTHTLPGKEVRRREKTALSRYVWLPIEWEGEKPVIRWQREWKV